MLMKVSNVVELCSAIVSGIVKIYGSTNMSLVVAHDKNRKVSKDKGDGSTLVNYKYRCRNVRF